jgi:hypothetical protein
MRNWQGIGLAAFSLTLLPEGLALGAGRVPARLVPVRPGARPCSPCTPSRPSTRSPGSSEPPRRSPWPAPSPWGVLAVTGCVPVGVFVQRAKAATP